MWIIWRLKALGASKQKLVDVLQKQVLSVLQLGVPALDSLITKEERNDIERVMKTGLRVIWGNEYSTYCQVLKEAKLKICNKSMTKL